MAEAAAGCVRWIQHHACFMAISRFHFCHFGYFPLSIFNPILVQSVAVNQWIQRADYISDIGYIFESLKKLFKNTEFLGSGPGISRFYNPAR